MLVNLLAAVGTLAAAAAPDPPLQPADRYPCSRAALAAAAQPPPGMEQRLRGNADTDVLHYDLDLEIDPPAQWIGGTNLMTVQSLVDGLTSFRFQLDDVFAVGPVQVNGSDASWQRVEFPTIEVTLDRAYDAGEQFELLVGYQGHPSGDGYFAPAIWFTWHGSQRIVATLTEPWYSYVWWPCKDDNRDKATAELALTVPDTMVVVSNGVLVSADDLGDGRKRYLWATGYQMVPYLFAFSATNYNVYTESYSYQGGSMPFVLYTFPEDDSSAHRQDWLEIMDMLDVFGDRYGLYPFSDEKYALYQFMMGGGMEHQTATGQAKYWGGWEWINAHELAHQWWGDMITCATWHDIWLNEGFATYSEAIWYENKPGGGGEDALHAHMANRRPDRFDDSVYCYDISNPGRIFSGNFTYRKGGWVLHMLRHVVGDQTFFDILAAWRAAYQYASATTDDFQTVAESVSGADLDWFFLPWVYDIGAPAYEYGQRQIVLGGQNYLELYLAQTQSSSYPVFTMPVDVVTTRAGNETVHVVWNDEPAEHFLLASDGPFDSLALDPKHWILTDPPDALEIPFVEGPPKIASMTPAPGSEVQPYELDALSVQFHKDVLAAAEDFALVGQNTGPVAFEFAYDSQSFVASLTPDGPLPGDNYTLTVADQIVDLAAGLNLDGEVPDGVSLPSGDGLPGGDALLVFSVAVGGDLDGDGDVDQSDLGILLADWGCSSGDCPGDIDDDGDTDQADLGILLANWGHGT